MTQRKNVFLVVLFFAAISCRKNEISSRLTDRETIVSVNQMLATTSTPPPVYMAVWSGVTGMKPTTAMAGRIASKNLPIWGLYSTKDTLVPVQWGRDFFSWIHAANPPYAAKTKLTIWTDASHNATWARAFNPATKIDGFNIYEWMLLFKR